MFSYNPEARYNYVFGFPSYHNGQLQQQTLLACHEGQKAEGPGSVDIHGLGS